MLVQTYFIASIGTVLLAATALHGVSPSAEEFEKRDAWVAAKFKGIQKDAPIDPGLVVIANYDPVQRNMHKGKPLRIKDRQFAHGLFCHAPSRIVVRLPSPGKTFSSMMGIDGNGTAAGGHGSVVFSASVNRETAFRTDVLREGMAAVPAVVDLKGATEFAIEISDAGDGNSCDQSCWADARVVLADGKALWLDDMTIIDGKKKGHSNEPFLSFQYDGQHSSKFLGTWKLERGSRELDAHRTEYTLTYTDPKTHLEVRCAGVAWKDYPTVEWTAYFKNGGTTDTPVLESLQAIDIVLERSPQGEFVLHHNTGDKCTIDSFSPLQTTLGPTVSRKFVSAGGRPTNFEWPYYNLEYPSEKEGVIIVLGWPGQWASQFVRDNGVGLHVTAGQESTHFRLHPGEQIRTPLAALQFYRGDWIRAQNIWRRWMFDHNFPKDHGNPLSPKVGAASVQYYGFNCNQSGDIEFINSFIEKGIQLNYWWMDAGWYKHDGVGWPKVGTWEVDEKRFPGGLRAISDHCHANGIELLVWFEVERVHADTWISRNHPEWVFGGTGGGLLKMNEPDVVRWLTDHIDNMITEGGIDFYRSDFNIDPLGYWRANDTEDRQGITEIRYVEGYLSYWDELRRRHPGMPIDSCASGGRRNDLETMRRAVPLLRTDFEGNPEGNQCHTYGFGLWLPYSNGVHNWHDSTYNFRSSIAPFVQRNWDVRKKDFDCDRAKRFLDQWRTVVDYYFGDFYPLSAYSTAEDVWMAWQFDRPDRSAGLVQAFRRANCPYVSALYKLRSLDPEARYVVFDLDTDQSRELTGRELMEKGVLVTIPQQPGAVLLTYTKLER